MVKIQDIARQMGLSTSTVYKALNGGADINKNTRAEILKVAARMGYIGKPKNFPHKRVCVFLERMELQQVTYYLYEIALAFKRAAAQHGFEVVIRSLGDDVLGYDQIMRQYCLQGALILGLNTADQYYKQLERLEHPTVLVDNYIENPNISCISADNMRGMTLVVQHLLSLGHQRIGFINGEENSSTSAERLNGYVSAITLGGLRYTPTLTQHGDFSEESGARCAHALVEQGVTALLCASDLMAIGAIRQLQQMGLRVPEDISVCGFDDIRLSRYITPGLTTVRIDVDSVGTRAFLCLQDLIAGGPCVKILEAPQLIVRQSTAAARTGR